MERDLVERAQHGDHGAFDALATSMFDRLYAIARRVLREQHTAEDAVQECLVRAWRDIPALRDPDRFEAWVYRLLMRSCADQARRERGFRHDVALLEFDAPDRVDETVALERRDEIERGFRRLSAEHRVVLVLHHYLGLRPAEIAALLDIREGTVTSRIHYGSRALRSALEADLRPAQAETGHAG